MDKECLKSEHAIYLSLQCPYVYDWFIVGGCQQVILAKHTHSVRSCTAAFVGDQSRARVEVPGTGVPQLA